METWDLYDGERRALGKIHRRGDDIAHGEYHVVVEIWTINSFGQILVTLRHPDKVDYPNEWENTCGSVLAGESSVNGALRELREETGITASVDELIFIGSEREYSAFIDTYVLKKDVSIDDMVMQEGETSAAKWVDFETLKKIAAEGLLARPVAMRLERINEDIKRLIEK